MTATTFAERAVTISRLLNAAVDKADAFDAELKTKTTILLEPGGFVVRMECHQRLACGFGVHAVCRTCSYGVFYDDNPDKNGLIGALNEVSMQMLDDRAEYARLRETGELTK